LSLATPSTVFWTPATTYLQPFALPHVTYDTCFGTVGAYGIDTGLTLGILPFDAFQAEVGDLRVFMAQLRRKIEADPNRPALLLTESGVGYRMKDA